MKLSEAQISFVGCLLVSLTDTMGLFFTAPVMVPYGQQLNATSSEIGGFATVFYIFGMFSLFWMPLLADAKGARIVMIVSVLGTALSYALQGNSHHFMPMDPKGGVWAMMAGRAIAGFFSGSMPVIRAHIADISFPNMSVLKYRSIIMWASLQAGNFALAPIAGLISRFGLHWPWYVSAAVSFLVLVFVFFFFRNADAMQDVQTDQDEDPALQKKVSRTASSGGPAPVRDPLLWLVLVAHVCLFLCASALLLLLPFLLEYEEFGFIDPSSVVKSRENVAAATSLVMVPHGILNLVFSTVGFLMISAKIGDRACLRIGSVGACAFFCAYGFGSSQMWHLMLYHGFAGIFVGLMVPAITPTLTSYNMVVHPTKTSQASAFPLMGMQIGQVIGPVLFGALLGEGGDRTIMNVIWVGAGVIWLIGYALLDLCFFVMLRHPEMQKLREGEKEVTEEKVKTMLEGDAREYDVFVNDMCSLIRGMLTPGHEEYRGMALWSGVAQQFVERVFRNSVPKFRTDPQGHLEDVAKWVANVGTEADQDWFHGHFPHIARPKRWNDSMLGAEAEQYETAFKTVQARRRASLRASVG